MAQRPLEDYVDVATRLQRFYDDHADGSVSAEIVHDDGKRIVMRGIAAYPSESYPNGICVSIGHAEEIRGDGMVNKTSALENAETSAWGRALAAAGYETKNGIASRQEMEKVQRMTAKPAAVKEQAEAKAPKTLTQAQVDKLYTKLAVVDPGRVQLELASMGVSDLPELTVAQANKLAKLAA